MSDPHTPTISQAIEDFEQGNYPAAIPCLIALSDAGNRQAQRYLADAYHLGLGVERDGKKAAELYLGVGKQNVKEDKLSAVAYNNLATLYFVGAPGVERDLEKGQEYLAFARGLGFEM